MIPCYICGQDASTGWVQGFAPAPDSQKLALCHLHDMPANRDKVASAWQNMHEQEISKTATVARQKASPQLQILSVQFTAGGMLSFTCTDCAPTEKGTLRIDEADGTQTFIPMQHVREYTLHPFVGDQALSIK